jgi:hypothetical protein
MAKVLWVIVKVRSPLRLTTQQDAAAAAAAKEKDKKVAQVLQSSAWFLKLAAVLPCSGDGLANLEQTLGFRSHLEKSGLHTRRELGDAATGHDL